MVMILSLLVIGQTLISVSIILGGDLVFENNIEISLNEISLDEGTKDTLKELIKNLFAEITLKHGHVDNTKVSIPDTGISIIKENNSFPTAKLNKTNKSKNSKATISQKLEATGLNKEIKDYIISEKGNIKKTVINDIVKVCLNTSASDLEIDLQKNLVDKIIENRTLLNIKNAEECSSLLIKSGKFDDKDLENWYSHIIMLSNELDEKLYVKTNIYEYLDIEQRKSLINILINLQSKINEIINFLD